MKNVVRVVAFGIAWALAGICHAQDWPSKPIRLVVPFAPAGPADIIARLLGQKLSEYLGQQVLVDNRAGAGGNIGAAVVAKSSPDGYTVLSTTSALAVNASLFPNPGYDAERDFIPIALVASQPNMIFVNASVPARTLAELFSLARTSKLAYASPGSGTTPHLTGENLFNVLAKLNMTPIHFRGAGPAVLAVVSGEPPVGSMAISGPLAQVKAGKLRVLAVSSAKRIAALPDVPTFAEAGFPGIEDYTWIGLFLPAGTPSPIVQKLNESVNRAVQSPDFRERLDTSAFEPVGGTQAQFASYMKAEIAKWAKVVRETGAKAD
jgi:tripartite-type tricarboxylate transporter receptor subunit TctC